MRLIAAALGVMVSVLAMTPATATPNEKWHYAVLAYGADHCTAWTYNHRQKRPGAIWEDAWIWGYVTAVNRWGGGPQDIAKTRDWDAINRWVDRYCAAHPDETIAEAAVRLIVTLEVGGGLPPHR